MFKRHELIETKFKVSSLIFGFCVSSQLKVPTMHVHSDYVPYKQLMA